MAVNIKKTISPLSCTVKGSATEDEHLHIKTKFSIVLITTRLQSHGFRPAYQVHKA